MTIVDKTDDGSVLKVTRVKVTSKTAEKWLTYNTHNRVPRQGVIQQWANDMKNGDWTTDIDPIAFHGYLDDPPEAAENCPEGCAVHPVLVNGQHRLHAIVASRMARHLLVVEGLALRDQVELDTGTRRRLDDQLRLRGISSAPDVAAILRLCLQWHRGELRSKNAAPAYSAVLRFLDKNPEILDSVAPARRLYVAIGGRMSVYGAARWIIGNINDPAIPDDVEEWWHLLTSGEGLDAGHPGLALRNAIVSNTAPAGSRRRRMTQVQMLALFFKAWNTWREGGTIATLSWRGGGKNPEPFPTPQ